MYKDIKSAIDNQDLDALKESLNMSTLITPKIYEVIRKNDPVSITKVFRDNESPLFMDILSFLAFDGELDIFIEIVELFDLKDLSYNNYECFRRAVSGEAEEIVSYIMDNYPVKVFVNNCEALQECVLEENMDLFKFIFNHRRCILSNQNLIELSDFCWKHDKDFASVVLQHKNFQNIMKSPLVQKVNKDIVNVYDSFIKISNF